MLLRQLFDCESCSYTYLIADAASGEAALIDPVREQVERDLQLVHELGLRLVHTLETHTHADHVTGAGVIRARLATRTVAAVTGADCADVHVAHGDVVRVGAIELRVLATPGHTPDAVTYVAGGDAFTGDALLVRGTGRTDFQHGDAGQLYDSITRVLFALPDATRVWPGHDYKGVTCSTIGEEKRHNPRLAGKSRDEFIAIMSALDLPPPRKLAEAVPANRACGDT
jgi:glyoxylase-like metal-dependent hydrolase (beta-lactamase superfamily II)